jgi:hypothetical protein
LLQRLIALTGDNESENNKGVHFRKYCVNLYDVEVKFAATLREVKIFLNFVSLCKTQTATTTHTAHTTFLMLRFSFCGQNQLYLEGQKYEIHSTGWFFFQQVRTPYIGQNELNVIGYVSMKCNQYNEVVISDVEYLVLLGCISQEAQKLHLEMYPDILD